MRKPALFLDRDGVINVDHGYVCKPENFEFIDGIFELVAAASNAGFLVIVITNQAGIGRGYYSEADFHSLTAWMNREFSKRGIHVDDVYFCPFHPIHGVGRYLKDSVCRKPEPGMILRAQKEHNIDLGCSVLIGDKLTDMEAGKRAGVGTLLYLEGKSDCADAIHITRLSQAIPYVLGRAER